MEFTHIPVLPEETIEQLHIKPDGIYVDGTVGGAGHASLVCSRLSDKGRLIGIDQDGEAVEAAAQRLESFGDRAVVVRSNYSVMDVVLRGLGIDKVDGILLDLGVSSHQLDDASRGFSYIADAPLDMRMDRRQERTARDIVNGYDVSELTRVIRDYGEERYASSIAKGVVRAREVKPIETTGELTAVIRASVPAKYRYDSGNPAKRTFQALRIELNQELKVLEDSLDMMIDLLNPDGRLCVITFHSLEDRIVKNCFKRNENPCTCPSDFPVCVCGNKPKGRSPVKKPIVPGEKELEANKRAKSAKLRVFERCAAGTR